MPDRRFGLLKELREVLPSRVVKAISKDSLELTDEGRLAAAQAARGAPESWIVITHDTDTMTDTARVLAADEERTGSGAVFVILTLQSSSLTTHRERPEWSRSMKL